MTNNRIASSVAAAFLLAAALVCKAPAQESILWAFQNADGEGFTPQAGLTFDGQGNLYGTTVVGGKYEQGSVYELIPQANGSWQYKTIYSFGAVSNDGSEPKAGVVFDTHGNLYGVTNQGGTQGIGTAFELSPQTGGVWAESKLYSIGTSPSGDDGTYPESNVVLDSSGNVYGVSAGGAADGGSVWELSPSTGGGWTISPVWVFGATNAKDGMRPNGPLIFDKDGNLYGVTSAGGANGEGTAFELSPGSGGTWTETILYNFQGPPNDAAEAAGALTFDSAGNLYGASTEGGADYIGSVFELSPGKGGWTETVLHSFSNANNNLDDGKYPAAGPVFDPLGNLYVTTTYGGAIYGSTGGGVVAELHPQGGGVWKETIVHSFPATSDDGYYPVDALIVDAQGNLYGTAANDGANGEGVAFELASPDLLAAPEITPGAGTFDAPLTVRISGAADATIYYTTNGEAPTTSSTKYSDPIEVSGPETIRAFVSAPGFIASKVVSAAFSFKAATPKLSVGTGKYAKAQTVEITDLTPHAVIHYTTNGTTPTKSSAVYSKAIEVASTETIKAMATYSDYTESAVVSATITIEKPTAKPVIAPAGGAVKSGTVVKITDATHGAVIHYTTNKSTPTASSPVFPAAGIKVTKAETIKAIAVASGYLESAEATAAFTLKP
jgi:uncharacterized repeat protein (TIGR03803 family)